MAEAIQDQIKKCDDNESILDKYQTDNSGCQVIFVKSLSSNNITNTRIYIQSSILQNC